MNKSMLRRAAAIALVTITAGIAACSSTPTREGTGQYVDDTVITAKVKAAVLAEPKLNSAEINVETFKGRVQLSGFLATQSDIDRAVSLARTIEGVTSVSNSMKLK